MREMFPSLKAACESLKYSVGGDPGRTALQFPFPPSTGTIKTLFKKSKEW